MNFICKDILRLLINEKCNGNTGMNCLLVCKRFNECVDRKVVIKKYLRQKIYEEHKDYIEMVNTNRCNKCNLILDDVKKLKGHMQKHEKLEKKGQKFQIYKLKKSCPYCEVPYIGSDKRHVKHCIMRIETCTTASISDIYPFIESLCNKPEGYIPEMRNHSCNIRCRECKEEFQYIVDDNRNYNSITEHLKTCVKRMDMISKYGHRKTKIVQSKIFSYKMITEKKFVCYYCDEETCKCICQECGKNHACKIVQGDSTRYLCYQCAKCESCGCNWNTADIDTKTWKYLSSPFCGNCII